MRVLVTGGAGFIGSHIVDNLIDSGIEVSVVDNLSTGFENNINPKAKFHKLDICDVELKNVFEKEKPRFVIHLAAQTLISDSVRDPIFDARVNILGSLNIITNCINFRVQRIVYASSCALYGKPEYFPVDENHPVNPLAPYGVSKHTVEHYLETQYILNNLSYIAFRYSNVYGPRQNPFGEGGVVAIFSRQLLSDEQPTIYGLGDKTRDYIYIYDVVKANVAALKSDLSGSYNISTGIETSDQKVFDQIKSESGYKGAPIYALERSGEIKRIFLSNEKAKNELHWQPQIEFNRGVSLTVKSYR